MQKMSVAVLVIVAPLAGCASIRTAPHMGFGALSVDAEIGRGDIEVLEAVEGTSSTKTIFFGIVQIVDDEHLRLFGIPFYEEKFVPLHWAESGRAVRNRTAMRAYHHALTQAPDADVVLQKSMEHARSGFPLIYSTERVTFHGKAIKLKAG